MKIVLSSSLSPRNGKIKNWRIKQILRSVVKMYAIDVGRSTGLVKCLKVCSLLKRVTLTKIKSTH